MRTSGISKRTVLSILALDHYWWSSQLSPRNSWMEFWLIEWISFIWYFQAKSQAFQQGYGWDLGDKYVWYSWQTYQHDDLELENPDYFRIY